jgi:glycine hydroxymethyltransferase
MKLIVDLELQDILEKEKKRQETTTNLIASENIPLPEVYEVAQNSFISKYAEGTIGRRFYQGCEYVDELESLAIERAKKLFDAESANVQPHCGSSANLIAYQAVLNPGDTVLSMDLSAGGHLSHGYSKHISSQLYRFIHYGVDQESGLIDYNALEEQVKKERPKLIVSGASAYSRLISYHTIDTIAKKYNCFHLADISHVAGLIAAKLIPSPVPYADIITSTTQKTLRGVRGAFILSKKDFEKKINQAVMPGMQGGPFVHLFAAKALLFKLAAEKNYVAYQQQVIENAQFMVDLFQKQEISIVSHGTDNHLFLIDLTKEKKTGAEIAIRLEQDAGIIVNKNAIPYDSLSPLLTSGIRIGTPTITAQGKTKDEIRCITQNIIDIIKNTY